MARVALVEDNAELAAIVAGSLHAAGLACDVFGTASALRIACKEVVYAALILDRGLPDGDGLSSLRSMRVAGLKTPCLILTARDAIHDRVDGLEAGADDYLTKPFSTEELVARVRALLRRPTALAPSIARFEDLEVDTRLSSLRCGDIEVLLSASGAQALVVLLNANGQVVSRRTLEGAAWGMSEPVMPNALDVVLFRLRRALVDVGSRCTIVNVRGRGYRLEHD